jgi:hypothetical protein
MSETTSFLFIECSHKTFDATLQDKIIARLGHYIRTELKTVFESLNLDECRYAIKVPITDEEKKLFNNSVTDVEAEADKIKELFETRMSEVTWRYFDFVQAGYIPTEFFEDAISSYKVKKIKVIQNLQKHKYIANEKANKFQVNGKRPYCYKLGQIWLSMLGLPVGDSMDRHSDRQNNKTTGTDPLKIAA